MARPGPGTGVTDPAAMGGVQAEPPQPGIRPPLSGNGDAQQCDADQVDDPGEGVGVVRGQPHRQDQKRGRGRLDLQEPEQPGLERRTPLGPQRGIARILGSLARTFGDVQAEAQRPEANHRRHHDLAGCGCARVGQQRRGHAADPHGEGPDRVDRSGIAGAALPEPGTAHGNRQKNDNREEWHHGPTAARSAEHARVSPPTKASTSAMTGASHRSGPASAPTIGACPRAG